MKLLVALDGAVTPLMGATWQSGTWASSGATGVINNTPNGTTAFMGLSSSIASSPLTVEASLTINDGTGLFVNSAALNNTSGVVFEISYVGDSTLLTLKVPGAASISGAVATITEIPCPFPRGSVQTIRLSPGQRGWAVHYRSGAAWLKLMDVSATDPPNRVPFFNIMASGSSTFSGFYTKTNGAVFDLVKFLRVGLVWNNGPGSRVLFSDHFLGPSGQTPYNTTNASDPGDPALVTHSGQVGPSTEFNTYLRAVQTAPGITIVNANSSIPNGIVSTDQPFQMICLDYAGGDGAIKLTIGGVMKNIYFNSSISGALKAITIESGAS